MSQVAILLWLPTLAASGSGDPVGVIPTSEPPSTTSAPSPGQRALLNRWAERRLLVLEAPHPQPPSRYPGYSSELVRRIEDLLEQARTLSGSLDEDRALEQLEAAENLVYEHPELPQAAFLLAEAASQKAELAQRRGQTALARSQRVRAQALEGKRAFTYTQQPASSSEPASPAAKLVRVEGLARSDLLEWNGQRQPSASAMASPGEHHVRVLRFGELAYSGFVMVPLDGDTVRLSIPAPYPCTLGDLAAVSAIGQRVTGQEHVHCPRWVVARPHEPSGIEVALCQKDRCGRFLSWQRGDGAGLSAPLHPEAGWRWPVWATYVGLGIGVFATTGAVLWQAGAFDEPERGPVTWTFGGVEN